ncbi:hypothetical protein F4775DRAFT_597537 [Biscogniauxia sp. FL1348]|nr:hypothetical protein F4775DRAFT_597537 [Biscogniauxia sp. FL1348]
MAYRSTRAYKDLCDLSQELVDYFYDKHKFEFIKSVQWRSGGALLCVKNEEPESSGKREGIVVKHGINQLRAWEIPGERQILEALRGAEHICQILAFQHDVVPDRDNDAWADAWIYSQKYPQVWDNPYIVLEAISGGTVDDFITKNAGKPVSQEILWILFLCLTRSCIAMAYPPYGEPGAPTRKEEIPPGVEQSGLSHCDLHSGNIMFGDSREDDEHYGVNPLKLIDFGLSQWLDDPDEATSDNLCAMAWVIVHLAIMKEAPFLNQSSAARLTIDGATGNVLGVKSSSSSSEDGVGDVTMASINPNDQSNQSAETGSSEKVDSPASLMNIDEEDEDYEPEDMEEVEEEYEEDEEDEGEGDVSVMSIDPDLSGFSGSSLDQGSSPMGAGVANASAMDISQSSGGTNPNAFDTFVTDEFYNLPLAENFKFLISRCLAADVQLRPSLAQMLQICESEVANIGNVRALAGQFTSMLMDAATHKSEEEEEEGGEDDDESSL